MITRQQMLFDSVIWRFNLLRISKSLLVLLCFMNGVNSSGQSGFSLATESDRSMPLNNQMQFRQNNVAEQDPNGLFWGLRDISADTLILPYQYQRIFPFKNDFAFILQNGKFGLIDVYGHTIVQPEYDRIISEMECGYIQFEQGYGPKLIFDSTGKSALPMLYGLTSILPCQKRLTYGHYQYGMLNFNGDTILPFIFTNAFLSSPGFCIASKPDSTGHNRLFGLYDINGIQLLPHVFEYFDGFFDGRSIVKRNGKLGVVDETGKELFYTDFVRIDRFHGGYAVVYKKQLNDEITVGVIDKFGKVIIQPIYQWMEQLPMVREGKVAVSQNFKCGFADTSGKIIIDFKYDNVRAFDHGIAQVWKDYHHGGYINAQGKEIIPIEFESLNQMNLRRYYDQYIAVKKDSVWYIFDFEGKIVKQLPYEQIGAFYENQVSFIVSHNQRWGILDSNFRIKIPLEYEYLQSIFSDKLLVIQNGKQGIINSNGSILLPLKYDYIEEFNADQLAPYENGILKVSIKGKYGLINNHLKVIAPVQYDDIYTMSEGLIRVEQNGKFGFINDKGKLVIPMIYESATDFDGQRSSVFQNGESFYIDPKGKKFEDYEEN